MTGFVKYSSPSLTWLPPVSAKTGVFFQSRPVADPIKPVVIQSRRETPDVSLVAVVAFVKDAPFGLLFFLPTDRLDTE